MWTVLVALMSNVVEDSRTVGRHAWFKQIAEVKQEDIFQSSYRIVQFRQINNTLIGHR